MNRYEDLEAVYVAPSEPVANMVRALLESEGIATMVDTQRTRFSKCAHIDSMAGELPWGSILVSKGDAARSIALIDAYAPDEEEGETARPTELNYTKSFSYSSIRLPYIMVACLLGVCAYQAWTGDGLALATWASTGGLMSLAGAILMSRSQKYVPLRFQTANARAAKALYVAAALSAVLFIACTPPDGDAKHARAPKWIAGLSLPCAAGALYEALRRPPVENSDDKAE